MGQRTYIPGQDTGKLMQDEINKFSNLLTDFLEFSKFTIVHNLFISFSQFFDMVYDKTGSRR
ncbi:MAG: hypothetical protein A3J81_02745 [Nitrospirae bacterium RIFOXYB2_FULL_43_5]|nr:MAG: hypothetical protein A2X54_08795 [Nitrospirae bacterium GWF2_44_13]OGW64957.1 MAG: hypothetical protein A2222_04920 [Nitrospirae bacterium RIFOXYA2_FULL_44_9]OGW74501.1 MAG: hypothetical protein A2484_09495 [Nitrospirae bacterium RIFOXYC2_FULL_44_7]OGW80117.1 MAG: hypothetical protein A3J81_02745 [Nitrospirae bacterium RIFOXYB2_FULL_43_5]HBG92817.1 hypothetical protein [Nitrospiraceae bacterium]